MSNNYPETKILYDVDDSYVYDDADFDTTSRVDTDIDTRDYTNPYTSDRYDTGITVPKLWGAGKFITLFIFQALFVLIPTALIMNAVDFYQLDFTFSLFMLWFVGRIVHLMSILPLARNLWKNMRFYFESPDYVHVPVFHLGFNSVMLSLFTGLVVMTTVSMYPF